MKILYGETFDDLIPIYCEIVFPNYPFTKSVKEITKAKFNIVWDEISDDQWDAYGYILDNLSIELWVAIQLVVITPYITSKWITFTVRWLIVLI